MTKGDLMNNSSKTPIISIDLKKSRIRIHRITLSLLGDPSFVQLLINPNIPEVVIHKSFEEDYLAHKVTYEKFKTDSYELYSKELIYRINQVSPNLQPNNSYRIEGILDKKGTLARFKLLNAVRIEKKENIRA